MRASCRAADSAIDIIPVKIDIKVTTTSSSTSVKPRDGRCVRRESE